jgi:hypothetical protein
VRGSQSPLEEFSVGSAHLDTVNPVKREGVADGLVHQLGGAGVAFRLRVDRHHGSPPGKHRKSDCGLVSWPIAARLSQASESTNEGEAENGRQKRERNDHVHVHVYLL